MSSDLRWVFNLCLAIAVLLAPSIALSQPASADDGNSAEESVLDAAFHNASVAEPAQGIATLKRLLAQTTDPVELSHVRFLIGRLLQVDGRCGDAIKEFQALEAAAAEDDPWLPRARFARSECLGTEGKRGAAVTLFANQAETLLEPERRERLAQQLVDLAREAREPAKAGVTPNLSRAMQLYSLVLNLEPGGELEEEAQHHVAVINHDLNTLATRIRQNPTGPWACKDRLAYAQGISDPGALFDTAKRCPADEAVGAAFALSAIERSARAVQTLREVIAAHPAHKRRDELERHLALMLIDNAPVDEAWTAVEAILGRTGSVEPAWILGAAQAFAARFEGEKARKLWLILQDHTTQPGLLEQARQQAVALRYREFQQHHVQGEMTEALAVLELLGTESPSELHRTKTIRGQVLAQMGRWEDARALWIEVGNPEAMRFLVDLLESRGLLEEAEPHRATFTTGERTEFLNVVVPRVFSARETPRLFVQSDGLAEMELRLHRIDVEDHMRSMATLEDLGLLDVDLIAPDETRKITLPAPTYAGYLKPGPVRGEVEIGALSPGVYALQSIGGEGIQSMSILTISNLAMVVRAAGGELVVMVVDQTTGAPVAGAEVIVTDGDRVVVEGKTDAQGLYRAAVESYEVEVLAQKGDQATWASSTAGGSSHSMTTARADVAKLRQIWGQLDREVVAPGESLRFLALVSEGESPRTLPTGTVEVQLMVDNQVLWTREVAMNSGVVEGTVEIPWDASPGGFVLQIAEEPLYFSVGPEGNLASRIRVLQSTPAAAGDAAEVIVEVVSPGGRPVAGSEVSGDLGDGRGFRALGMTDVDGHLALAVQTDLGLPPSTLSIEGIAFPVEMAREVGELEIEMPIVEANTDTPYEVRWEGGESARAFVRVRQVQLTTPHRPPIFQPSWWMPAGQTGTLRFIHSEALPMTNGKLFANLPALAPGAYVLDVEVLREDGATHSRSRPIVIADDASLMLSVPECPERWSSPCELDYQQTIRVSARGDATLPMLVTVERQGILQDLILKPGEEASLTLSEDLVGDARLVVTQMGADASNARQFTRQIVVERRREVQLAFDASSGHVEVEVTDPLGNPISAPVFLAMLPAEDISEQTHPLFLAQSSAIEGFSGWSRASNIATASGDSAVALRDLVSDLNLASYTAGSTPTPQTRQHIERSFVHTATRETSPFGGIASRRHPALWVQVETDASGRAVAPVLTDALSRGPYQLVAVTLEGIGKSTGGIGDRGVVVRKGVWVDATPAAPTSDALVKAGVADHRVVLFPGESITLPADGAEGFIAEVARSDRADWVARLLTPDLALHRESTWWQEQLVTYQMMAERKPEWAGERLVTRRWIAHRQLAQAQHSTTPTVHKELYELVGMLESLPEDDVRKRAEVLLGIAYRQPDHGQARAALLRLRRNTAAQAPEVVGTLALAALALGTEFGEVKALEPALNDAVAKGGALAQARALEALARLEAPLPVEPVAQMKALDAHAEAHPDREVAMIMGSLTRALLLADPGVGGDAGLMINEAGQAPTPLPAGRTVQALTMGGATVTLTATDEPVALRLALVDETPAAAKGFSISRVAQRHGVWFRGMEILPKPNLEVEEIRHPISGRRLRVRLEVDRTGGSNPGTMRIEAPLPVGAQFISDSVTGGQLRSIHDDHVVLTCSGFSHQIITYDVELLAPTEGLSAEAIAWRPTLLRAPNGEVVAASAASPLRIHGESSEEAARLDGEPVWPPEAPDLTESEKMALGTAIEASETVDADLHQTSLSLLWPLLFGSKLTSDEVRLTGEAAFKAALALGDDQSVREVFGILEARAPQASVTQEQLLQVARAFDRQGDLEYAHRAWTALLNLRFLAEVGAGEGLISVGLPAEGLHLVHNLTRSYPDIPSVRQSLFNLPQLMLNQAQLQPETPEGRVEAQRHRQTAARWLAEFLVRYRDDAQADQAALMQINVVRELERWERMIQLAEQHSVRFAESRLVDSFIFLAAYGYQRLGDYKEASVRFKRVAEEEFHEAPSSDRERAKLAIAQIHQAKGELVEALKLYREVQGLFADAAAAVQILENAELRVPNVVDAKPGAGLTLPLRVRGVDQLRVWVYAVDLEQLFLREKQIRAVEDISLAGIKPVLDFEEKLGTVYGNLVDHPLKLNLKKPGAYLVLLRGPTVRASTLAIVTDVKMDIVEDTGSGTLHVSVSSINDSTPKEGALVRYAHPGAAQTQSSKSDLRGMVKLPNFNRSAHILARVGDSYAVYRGAEPELYAMPSQIQTYGRRSPNAKRKRRQPPRGHGGRQKQMNFEDEFDFEESSPAAASDSLIQGQKSRALEIQMDNIQNYEGEVLHNRRGSSNFLLH